MQDLYVLGGVQRPSVADTQQEWLLFEKAVIARVHPRAGDGELCVEHETPAAYRPSDQSSVIFKSGAVEGGRLYACTSTEVMVFDLPSFERAVYISLPCFNDLHHVRPTPWGTLVVAVTGLDMVVEVSLGGELLRTWSALGGEPRFAADTDYRKIPTLKPYRTHVNFVSMIQGELWATRGDLGDAICLTAPGRSITLGAAACVHDGWLAEGRLYFTSVDGHLYLVDELSLQVEASFDLNAMVPPAPGYGWCRGVLPVDERRVWVGFTRIRPTRWKEKVRWMKNMVSGVAPPTRLVLYDLADARMLASVNLEPLGLHAMFNALPAAA